MDDIMISNSYTFEESSSLVKIVSETIENIANCKKIYFLACY